MPIEVGWVDPGIFDWGGGRGVETLIQKRLLNFFVENYPGEGGGVGYSLTRGFHNWSDYNGVTLSIELLEWGRKFSDFGGK